MRVPDVAELWERGLFMIFNISSDVIKARVYVVANVPSSFSIKSNRNVFERGLSYLIERLV